MKWSDIQQLVPTSGRDPDFEACLRAFPSLEFAKQTPQGAYHREGDVWTHTKMVLNELLALPAYQSSPRADQEILYLAALLHDIAKYSTTVIDPDTGNISQPGHSARGAVDARIALWDLGVPFAVREAICGLIRVHQLPFFATTGSRNGKSPEFIVRELSWQARISLLSTLAEADMRGRICDDKQGVLNNIDQFRNLAREEGCYDTPRHFADAHTRVRYFRGANVHPDYPLYQEKGSEVTVMAGLPASGKNHYVTTHLHGLPVLSFDDMLEELGMRHGKNNGKAAHAAVDRAKELLRKKAPFVWNATNISDLMRTKCLDLLYRYDAQVRIVYIEQPRPVLLRRNKSRDTTLTNKALEAMLHRWNPPLVTEAHSVEYFA